MLNLDGFYGCDWQEISRGGSDEEAIGFFEVGQGEGLFSDFDAGDVDFFEKQGAGDSWQAARGDGWGEHEVAVDGEEVGRGEFANFVALVEQNYFVKAILVGLIVHAEVEAPGEHLGAGELIGGVAGVGDDAKFDALAPVFKIGGECVEIKGALDCRAFPHAAFVTQDDDTEGSVVGVVGFNEFVELGFKPVCGIGEGNLEEGSIFRHTVVVALPFKEDAVFDAECGEDTPTVDCTYLPWGHGFGGGGQHCLIDQHEIVHETFILVCSD